MEGRRVGGARPDYSTATPATSRQLPQATANHSNKTAKTPTTPRRRVDIAPNAAPPRANQTDRRLQ